MSETTESAVCIGNAHEEPSRAEGTLVECERERTVAEVGAVVVGRQHHVHHGYVAGGRLA